MNQIIKTAVLGTSVAFSGAAFADDFPSKPIRLVIPFAAGGNSDVLGRMLAERMGINMKQTFIVDNKAGAGGSLGTTEVAKAAPDGYTILLATSSTHAINPAVYTKLKYDVLKDFAPITTLALSEYALVVPAASPYKTIDEMLKGNAKGQLKYASNGNGTTSHLAAALLELKARTQFVHVPYKSSSPAMTDVMGGQVDFLIDNTSTALQQATTGRLRILATTGGKRAAPTQNVPTMIESGVRDYEVIGWWALMAPAGTPAAVVERLNKEVIKAVSDAGIRDRMVAMGNDPFTKTPAETRAFIESELKKFRGIADATGLKLE